MKSRTASATFCGFGADGVSGVHQRDTVAVGDVSADGVSGGHQGDTVAVCDVSADGVSIDTKVTL